MQKARKEVLNSITMPLLFQASEIIVNRSTLEIFEQWSDT